MIILKIIYVLLLIITAIVGYVFVSIRSHGIKVRDFWSFIKAVQNLDFLYKFSSKYEKMNSQEQVIFLSEAEKVFDAFDKVPKQIWEDEYDKYSHILDTYRSIKMIRWEEARSCL